MKPCSGGRTRQNATESQTWLDRGRKNRWLKHHSTYRISRKLPLLLLCLASRKRRHPAIAPGHYGRAISGGGNADALARSVARNQRELVYSSSSKVGVALAAKIGGVRPGRHAMLGTAICSCLARPR